MRTSSGLPLLAAVALAACANSPLTTGGDDAGVVGIVDMHVGPPPDLTFVQPRTCDQLAQAAEQYFAAHQSCQRDSDCSLIQTGCGLPGVCGAIIALDPSSSELPDLFVQWKAQQCTGPCPPCAFNRNRPTCQMGTCTLVNIDPSQGAVGDACSTAMDCSDGAQCLTASPFVGGYCSLASCDQINRLCPAESDCHPAGGAEWDCLRRCAPHGWDCRGGYDCCPSASFPGQGWCYPDSVSPCPH